MTKQDFIQSLTDAGCDFNKLSDDIIKIIENIEELEKPQIISNGKIVTAEVTKLKTIIDLLIDDSTFSEMYYFRKAIDYLNLCNFTGACNCICIIEALTLEDSRTHIDYWYPCISNMHRTLLELIKGEVS